MDGQLARLSPAEPATIRTRYQIASISKTLTSQALLRLEQDGKFSLGVLSFDLHSESEADGLTTRIYDIVDGPQRLRPVEQVASDGRVESFQVQPALN